jgi:hypothetical protein
LEKKIERDKIVEDECNKLAKILYGQSSFIDIHRHENKWRIFVWINAHKVSDCGVQGNTMDRYPVLIALKRRIIE